MDFRDELTILAWTVVMEASGEPYEGKLAVAYVICTRAKRDGRTLFDVCLKPYQFSAWNTESPTRMRLDDQPQGVLRECYKAACSAYFQIEADPTKGSTHYLNEEATRKLNGGKLPSWFRESEVRARIGRHTFLVA